METRLGHLCETQQLHLSPGSALPSAPRFCVCGSPARLWAHTRGGRAEDCERGWSLPRGAPSQELDWEAVVAIGIGTRRVVPSSQQVGKEDRPWGRERSGSQGAW